MFRQALFVLLIISGSNAFASDADVLRYNYHKAPATKPAVAPATTLPRSSDTLHKRVAPTALLTASTKLEPR